MKSFKHTSMRMRSLAAAAALMVAGSGTALAGDFDGLTQEAKDAYRHGQIWATYATTPLLEARDIDVDVEGDAVTLTGVVETVGEKNLAGLIADGTDGIDTVHNRLRVDPELVVVTTMTPMRSYAQMVADAELAANIDAMLLWNQYTDGLDINVSARNGVATLTGVADTPAAKKRAADIAMEAQGIKAVINNLTVDGDAGNTVADVDDDWIEEKIENTYLFSGAVNSALVEVDADNGTVMLDGKVANAYQRERAIQLAQDTRGVTRVDASGLSVNTES
jgi:hyperosmotically inducible protein